MVVHGVLECCGLHHVTCGYLPIMLHGVICPSHRIRYSWAFPLPWPSRKIGVFRHAEYGFERHWGFLDLATKSVTETIGYHLSRKLN